MDRLEVGFGYLFEEREPKLYVWLFRLKQILSVLFDISLNERDFGKSWREALFPWLC